jgi:hypothetical protein
MKYRLPRQIIDPQICEVIAWAIRETDCPVTRAPNKRVKELADVCQVIQHQGIPKHLICKKLPHNLGRGIFLAPDAKPIARHEMIGPYSGDVSIVAENAPDDTGYAFAPIASFHLTKPEQAYFDPKNRYHPRRLYSMKLDALKHGNFTRFINHSENPNVEACAYSIPKNNRYGLAPSPVEILYIAKKTIHPGEQLLICYEEDEGSYWGALDIEPYPMTPKTFQLLPSLQLLET